MNAQFISCYFEDNLIESNRVIAMAFDFFDKNSARIERATGKNGSIISYARAKKDIQERAEKEAISFFSGDVGNYQEFCNWKLFVSIDLVKSRVIFGKQGDEIKSAEIWQDVFEIIKPTLPEYAYLHQGPMPISLGYTYGINLCLTDEPLQDIEERGSEIEAWSKICQKKGWKESIRDFFEFSILSKNHLNRIKPSEREKLIDIGQDKFLWVNIQPEHGRLA